MSYSAPGRSIERRIAIEEYIGFDVSAEGTAIWIRQVGKRMWAVFPRGGPGRQICQSRAIRRNPRRVRASCAIAGSQARARSGHFLFLVAIQGSK